MAPTHGMSQIAPDIPELRGVTESARGIVYMRALGAAMRSPATLVAGALLILLAAAIGGTPGYRLFGIVGALIGASLGTAVAAALFCRVLLPWPRGARPRVLRGPTLARWNRSRAQTTPWHGW